MSERQWCWQVLDKDPVKHVIEPDRFDDVAPVELERELAHGVALAQANARARELRAHADAVEANRRKDLAEIASLRAQLKVMEEDRDGFKKAFKDQCLSQEVSERLAHAPRAALDAVSAIIDAPDDACNITAAMAGASADELTLVLRIARKLMGEGRREYGPFCVATDERTGDDLREQAMDEHADGYAYNVMAKMIDERKP